MNGLMAKRRDALPRVRRRTSGNRSSLYVYSPPWFVRSFTFCGRATPDARERIPTAPRATSYHYETLALFAEFHAQSLRAEGCNNSDGGSHNRSGDGKRQPVIITE
jgi:hypothetical protein